MALRKKKKEAVFNRLIRNREESVLISFFGFPAGIYWIDTAHIERVSLKARFKSFSCSTAEALSAPCSFFFFTLMGVFCNTSNHCVLFGNNDSDHIMV